jgi:hypothetical protein
VCVCAFLLAKYHGKGGLLTISGQNYQPGVKEWMKAARELGLNNSDPNAGQTSSNLHILFVSP